MQSLVIKLCIWLVKGMFPMYWSVPTSLIFAQAFHETGKFTSAIFKENNNLFGMKVSKATPGGFIEIGENRGHAVYKNWIDAIRDYFVRQRYFKITAANYVEDTVKSGYAEDTNYKKAWLNTWEKMKLSGSGKLVRLVLLVIAIVCGFWLVRKRVKR